MHDIKLIRDNPAAFDAGLARRGLSGQSGAILAVDGDLRALMARLQEMQATRNDAAKKIGQAKAKKDETEAQRLMAEVAGLKDAIQKGEDEERVLQERLKTLLSGIPNLPAADVPDGKDEAANVEVRRFGAPKNFAFNPREHFEIGETLGLMDFEAAGRVSGARFVFLKGGLARLERALGAFMLDLHTSEFGYTEMNPPLLVRDEAMFGTAQLPKFVDDQFTAARTISREELLFNALGRFDEEIERHPSRKPTEVMKEMLAGAPTREDFWLVPTAEVSLTNYVREQILDDAALPMRMTAQTPCFRAEAGAAGRDTRGMIRMHQFTKVELVSVTTPEQSDAEHERMTACAEEVLKRLDIPYRVMALSTGDLGFAARKTYDIEVWLPGQGAYREISSCSYCGDFQARRMDARYRPKGEKGTRYVHTLNGSGLAVGRTLIAVIENYQNEDGSITVPPVLRGYMGGVMRIGGRA